MAKEKVYKLNHTEYTKMLRNEDRILKLKEAVKPINKILSQIRTDRIRTRRK